MHCSRVDAFRHRAASIIADRAAASHVYPLLTLIGAHRRCEERSDEAIQFFCPVSGLLRFARNDG
jgi:hypothetical protein